MPMGWNATAVTLVPKVAAPQSIKDYRPIACCITLYKCITQILANRRQAVLPSIIGPSQSAFIKGRSIMDNTLLMQELVRDYHRDQGPPRCAIKLDIMKAYYRVDWDFLIAVVTHMEFPLQYIHWVSACASTPRFSIVINGELKGFFLGRRGLRQGDPISPYLFLLVMDAFSFILQSRIGQGGFSYHPKCAAINLSHLAFADDMFIVCGATPQSFETINSVLKEVVWDSKAS